MDELDAPVLFHHDETMPPVEPGTFGFGGAWTRRSVLLGSAGAGLAALLAACGGDNKSSGSSTTAGANTTAPSSGSSTSAGGSASSSASTAPPARTEAKTETITI